MTPALPAMRNHNMMYAAAVTFMEYLSTNAQSAAGNQITHRGVL